jgi:DivIVA domain-containing protein
MSSEMQPDRRFRTVMRGYDPKQVDDALAELQRSIDSLQAQRDRMAGRLGEFADRDLSSEFAAVGRDVGSILEQARQAAEGLRERAAADAARWRAEAMAESEGERRAARADAEHLRGDAWTAAEEMIKQTQAETRRQREAAERDSLTVLGEAEREAHRLTAAARREGDDLLRVARMESERMTTDAKGRQDEIIEQARRQAEQSQERARALEQRRVELLGELDSVRETMSRVEKELEEKRELLGFSEPSTQTVRVVRPEAVEPPSGQWEMGETVRVVGRRRDEADEERVTEPSAPVPAVVVSAPPEIEVEEVGAVEEAEEPPPSAPESPPPPAAEEPAPAAAETPAAPEPEAVEASADDLDVLFQRLRGPSEGSANGASGTADEVTPAPAPAVPAAGLGFDPFDMRDRLLLPISNRALRNVKRQLTEAQNEALEQIRVSEGRWHADAEALAELLRADLVVLTSEGFGAGHSAAEEMTGGRVPRPPTPKVDEAPAFAEALAAEINGAVTDGSRGARAVGTAVSRVFRAWRNDLAERRLRDIGTAAFTRGLVASASGNYEVAWVVGGRGCAECRAAAESGSIDPGPPLHPGCSCALVVRT